MNSQLSHFLSEHKFSEQEIEEINKSVVELELPTRHILTNQGEMPEYLYLVVEGVCHAAYLTEKGKVYSKEFYCEGDWAIGFEALIKDSSSPYLLETLTECHLICLPIAILENWRSNNHSAYTTLLETQLLHKANTERFKLFYSPEERFELFSCRFPDLITRMSDHHIAAYLGTSPTNLSRIKNQQK